MKKLKKILQAIVGIILGIFGGIALAEILKWYTKKHRRVKMKNNFNLRKYGEELKRGQWNRLLKYFKGNRKKTLNCIIKDLQRQLKASKEITKRDILFFRKLSKER